jgi:hypothetical protein
MSNNFLHQYQVLYRKAVSDLQMAKLASDAGDELIDDATIVFQSSCGEINKITSGTPQLSFRKDTRFNNSGRTGISQWNVNAYDLKRYYKRANINYYRE